MIDSFSITLTGGYAVAGVIIFLTGLWLSFAEVYKMIKELLKK